MGVLHKGNIGWKKYHENQGLDIEHVHVFKFLVDEAYDQIAAEYSSILSKNETIKANSFLHIDDQKRFIVGKYMLRMILSRLISLAPESIQFKLSDHKKPFVDAEIEFNTAHSGNIVLIAVHKKSVGIDIEFINRNFEYEGLISDVFSNREKLFINSGPNRSIDFYLLWTRKEALLKATGEGLLDRLQELDCLESIIYRNGIQYYLSSLLLEKEYAASIAHCTGAEILFWE